MQIIRDCKIISFNNNHFCLSNVAISHAWVSSLSFLLRHLSCLVSLDSKPTGQAAVDVIEAHFKQKIPLRQAQQALQKLRFKTEKDHILDWQKMGLYTELFIKQIMISLIDENIFWSFLPHISLSYDLIRNKIIF